MAEMSESLARSVISEYEKTGNHYPLTSWELVQLAWTWLKHHGHEVPEKISTPWSRPKPSEVQK